MGADLEVKVLLEVGHNNRREAQGREGERASEGSVERSRGLMDKNRIRGTGSRGEWANDYKAPVAKGDWCKSGGGAAKVSARTRGGLALRLKGRGGCQATEREVSLSSQ